MWVEQTTTYGPTRYTPFYLNAGHKCMLPIKKDISTWEVLPWDEVQTTADLLAVHAKQFERLKEDLQEAMLSARRKRECRKETFDASHRTHLEFSFKAGDIVLLHDTILDANMSVKLHYKWIGPYRIRMVIPGKGTYTLEELDSTVQTGTITGNRIKHLY